MNNKFNKSKLLQLILECIKMEPESYNSDSVISNQLFNEASDYQHFNYLINIVILIANIDIKKRIVENLFKNDKKWEKKYGNLLSKIIPYKPKDDILVSEIILNSKNMMELTLNSFESIKNNKVLMSEMLTSYVRFTKYNLREKALLILKN